MKKTYMTLMALVLCMVLSVSALASSVPSKTLDDMTYATTEGEFEIIVITDETDIMGWVPAEIEKITSCVSEGNEVASYFDAEVFAAGENDVNGLTCVEAEAVYAEGYNAAMGDQKVTFTFPAVYEQDLILMIGVCNEAENTVSYTAFDAVANEEGEVEVVFDAATLENMEGIENQVLMLLLGRTVEA